MADQPVAAGVPGDGGRPRTGRFMDHDDGCSGNGSPAFLNDESSDAGGGDALSVNGDGKHERCGDGNECRPDGKQAEQWTSIRLIHRFEKIVCGLVLQADTT